MAETLVSNIAGAVLKKIASLALPEINLAWGVKNELRKLENTLSTIKSVLSDAEKQQAKNHAVKDWLEKLKDVVYDIDDVLDDFSTETLRWKVEVRGSLIKEHLKALRTLVISHCPGLTSLPSEMKYLIALETLHIFCCPELDLLEGEGMQGIKNLRSLILESLPKLVALPEGLQHAASTLQCLRILRCTGFATIPEWLRNFTSLQKLELENCPLLCPSEGMRSLPPVQELRIKGSSDLSRICRREIDDAIDLQSEPDNHSYQWRAIHIPDDVSLDSDAYDLDIYLEHKDFETDSYDIGNMDDDKSEDTDSAYSFSMPDC
ncbi:hypothetical protein HYC85_025791 [Camellia sinensis]|uniref:Disease resistance N-terminal domain-containing protein n=1 Tax=Camellia sinensis TaxID=4442 RepID=A0A7J7GDA7_CAMSI|nr:hypothetical protein HYC85_025791 [Camellia sinensis]